jgi:hypothetical protein
MTEGEWLISTDPQAMLVFVPASGKATDRKLRLFAAAAVRPHWAVLIEQHSRDAVELSEEVADGTRRLDDLAAAYRQPGTCCPGSAAVLQDRRRGQFARRGVLPPHRLDRSLAGADGLWLAAEDREGLGVTSPPVLRDLYDRLSFARLGILADAGGPPGYALLAQLRAVACRVSGRLLTCQPEPPIASPSCLGLRKPGCGRPG